MSASREKQKRMEVREGGIEPIKRKASPQSDGRRKRVVGIVAGVLALLVILLFVYASGTLHKNMSVLTVGQSRVSPTEYNYHYVSQKWGVYEFYYSYLGYAVFDPAQPLSGQEYNGDESWADYINEITTENLKTMLQQYNLALRDGTQMTEEDREAVESSLTSLQQNAADQGMDTQRYIDAIYGQSMTLALLREYMERSTLANRWAADKKESYDFSDEDLQAYYVEHKTDFDLVTYESYTLDGVLSEGTDEQKEAFYNEVKTLADEMQAKVTTPEAFNALAADYAARYDEIIGRYAPETEEDEGEETEADEDAEDEPPAVTTLREKTAYTSVSGDDAKAWLFDDARVKGDKTILETDKKITLYSYISKSRDETPATYAVRHILATFESDEPTDEDKEAARERAEDILARWKSGAATEESFGELANEESDDQGGAVTDGGIYQDLDASTNFVEPFKEWYLDPVRKPGDTGIIETEYGYHVMYFVSSEGIAWRTQADSQMLEETYSAYMEDATKDMKIKESSFGMYLTNIGK